MEDRFKKFPISEDFLDNTSTTLNSSNFKQFLAEVVASANVTAGVGYSASQLIESVVNVDRPIQPLKRTLYERRNGITNIKTRLPIKAPITNFHRDLQTLVNSISATIEQLLVFDLAQVNTQNEVFNYTDQLSTDFTPTQPSLAAPSNLLAFTDGELRLTFAEIYNDIADGVVTDLSSFIVDRRLVTKFIYRANQTLEELRQTITPIPRSLSLFSIPLSNIYSDDFDVTQRLDVAAALVAIANQVAAPNTTLFWNNVANRIYNGTFTDDDIQVISDTLQRNPTLTVSLLNVYDTNEVPDQTLDLYSRSGLTPDDIALFARDARKHNFLLGVTGDILGASCCHLIQCVTQWNNLIGAVTSKDEFDVGTSLLEEAIRLLNLLNLTQLAPYENLLRSTFENIVLESSGIEDSIVSSNILMQNV